MNNNTNSNTPIIDGAAHAWVVNDPRFPLDPDVYYLTHLPFSPHTIDLFWVGLATMLMSFLATLYPAFKAAALDPVEAIRHE